MIQINAKFFHNKVLDILNLFLYNLHLLLQVVRSVLHVSLQSETMFLKSLYLL
jgi:hypothetical protein